MLMEGSHWLNNSRSSQPQTPSAETEAETANTSNESESTKAQGKEENMILMVWTKYFKQLSKSQLFLNPSFNNSQALNKYLYASF